MSQRLDITNNNSNAARVPAQWQNEKSNKKNYNDRNEIELGWMRKKEHFIHFIVSAEHLLGRYRILSLFSTHIITLIIYYDALNKRMTQRAQLMHFNVVTFLLPLLLLLWLLCAHTPTLTTFSIINSNQLNHPIVEQKLYMKNKTTFYWKVCCWMYACPKEWQNELMEK